MKSLTKILVVSEIALLLIVAIGILQITLSPVIIFTSILVLIASSITSAVIAIILIYIWYLSRKEPELGKNKSYSISQGKEK